MEKVKFTVCAKNEMLKKFSEGGKLEISVEV